MSVEKCMHGKLLRKSERALARGGSRAINTRWFLLSPPAFAPRCHSGRTAKISRFAHQTIMLFSTANLPGLLLAGITAGLIYTISIAIHRRLFHPLSHIPGPFLASVTHLYKFYYNVGNVSRFYSHIAKLHEKYGMLFLNCHDHISFHFTQPR